MPYTLHLGVLDLAEYYSDGYPAFAGSIVNPRWVGGSGAAFDTATTTTSSPLTLEFASPAVPPVTASATLVLDSGTSGDVLRSGVVSELPPSPASATVITIDPVPIPAPEISAATAGRGIPPTPVPYEVRLVSGLLTLGLWIPLVAVLADPIVSLGTAPGTVDVKVTGSLAVRVFYFWVRTYDLSLTVTVAPAPSNDAEAPSRIVRTPLTASSLVAAFSSLPNGLGAVLASTIAGMLESVVNETIVGRARFEVSAKGMRLTPTAVICARDVTVIPPTAGGSGGGVNLQLAVSDLFGRALEPVARTLAVAISPTPKATTVQAYTVTVTDAANGSPVPGATVTLRNYAVNGAVAWATQTTDPAGRAGFTVALRKKVTSVVVITSTNGPIERERESTTVSPVLTVNAAGSDTVRIALL